MANDQTGSILIHVFDGTRQPLPPTVEWQGTVHNQRASNEQAKVDISGKGYLKLVEELPYTGMYFDNYTVILNAPKREDAAWMPIPITPLRPAAANLMLLPKNGKVNFDSADWKALNRFRPQFAEILSSGITNAATRYNSLTKQDPLVAACLLNLLTAMSQITLPTEKSPLDYFWQPIWDDPEFEMAQDRFYAYVDEAIVDDVVKAAKLGAFAEEKNPGTWHPGATLSYKQTQFDVTNVQLTFHQGNAKKITGPNGPVDCVVIEPDIDYYKDPTAHSLLEVLPNKFTQGLTDPRGVYLLRWTASKQAGLDFNPLFTIPG